MRYVSLIILLILYAVGAAYGQLYEYKDANGNTVFTDSPPSGAAASEKNVGDRVYRSTRVESSHPVEKVKRAGTAARREEPAKKDYSRVSVVMYMTDW